MHKIVAENVSKTLKNRQVLKNINLSLESKKIYGFVGENGSGKTMLFRVLSGLSKPTCGYVKFDDKDLHSKYREYLNIGITIEHSSLYPDFTGFENLNFLSKIREIASKKDIENAIERVGLDPNDKRTYRRYSLGMKHRILLAQAIMEKPDFLFLDEPTNAIDKDGVELVHRIIKEESDRGAIVLMTSHISDDINSLANEVFFVKDGIVESISGKPVVKK